MIVILGVIALIITPIVTGVIKKQEKKTFEESIYGILKTIEIDTANNAFKTPREYKYENEKLYLIKVGNIELNEIVKTNGKYNGTGYFYVDDDGIPLIKEACNEKYCATNSVEDPIVKIEEKEDPSIEQLNPVIELNGDATVTVGIGSTFTDPGAVAKTKGGETLEYRTEIKKGSSVVTSIDTSTVSTYTITYKATNNNKTVTVTRTVKIVDGMGPIITFNPETVTITSAEARTYNLCTGVTITDNLDGEIDCSNAKTIGSLGIEPNTYTITYSITDSNGNKTEKTRTFIVTDSDKPVITISPNEQSTYVQSKEVSISATDNVGISSLSYVITKDGVVGTSTTVTGTNETITLNETGIYTITVTAIDTSNNSESKTSGEYKIDKEPPSLSYYSAKK